MVTAAIAVPRGTAATKSGNNISFTLPKAVNNRNIIEQITSGTLDAYGLTNCPALTVGNDLVVVGGNVIILPDADGIGGDLEVDGDMDIDGDINMDDGDINMDDGIDDNGMSSISTKGCSDRQKLSNATNLAGSIWSITLPSPLGMDFKGGDPIHFFVDGDTDVPSFSGTLNTDVSGNNRTFIITTTGALTSLFHMIVCPATGTIQIDGDGDGDGMVEIDGDGNIDMDGDLGFDDGNDDTGNGMVGTKGCSGQVAISNIASNGSVLTLLTGIANDYKSGDPVTFYNLQGTEITTVTAQLSSDISKGGAILNIVSTGGALSSLTTGTLLEICPATGTLIIDGDTDGDGTVEIDGDGNVDMDGDLGFDNDMDGNGNGMIGTKPCSPRIEITTILGKNTVLQETTYTVALEDQILDSFNPDDVVDVYANFTSLQKRFSGITPYKIWEESGIITIRVKATDIIEVGDHIEVCPATGTLMIDGDTDSDGGGVGIDGDGNIQTDGMVGVGDGMIGNDQGDSSTDPGETIEHEITAVASAGSSGSGQTVRLTFSKAIGISVRSNRSNCNL